MRIAHFGTFDVANYGDLLFPLIAQRRLAAAGCRLTHVSPVGGPPVWDDCVETVSLEQMFDDAGPLDAVLTGGGHLLHASPARLPDYQRGGMTSLVAYPGLWLGAAHLAARRGVPACWNAPGVPLAFSPAGERMIRWTGEVVDYRSVRDERSRELLVRAGCREPIAVVPDTALDVAGLWSDEQIEEAYHDAFTWRGRAVPHRSVAIHLNERYIDEEPSTVARRVDDIARIMDAVPILIALGPCHGDDVLARRVAQQMQSDSLLVDRPRSLQEAAACIGRSWAYFGSSLHGMITACAFGRRGVVVAREAEGQGGKFSGFLAPLGLSPWLADSWQAAGNLAERLRQADDEPWRQASATAAPLLDDHWNRLRHIVSGGNQPAGAHQPAEKQALLDEFDRLCRKHFGGGSIFQGVLMEQASRVGDALAAAGSDARKLSELRAAHEQMKQDFHAELDIRKAQSAEREQRLHAEIARQQVSLRQAENDAETLAGWIEQLESGVAALLSSRRWRAGDLLGKVWSRLTRKPSVPMATDLLQGVFHRFYQRNLHDAISAVDDFAPVSPVGFDSITADVIVCVHNALADVERCLQSLLESTPSRHRLILIDDGSDGECRQLLADFIARRPDTLLVRNDQALGYTRGANIGLGQATADYVVLLNSDTQVAPRWLDRLIECGESDPRIGLIGPLSNAASWQSVPERFDEQGDWAVNRLPDGYTPADVAAAVDASSERAFPRVALLNGFCLAIKRAVIEQVGLLDEDSFRYGYGEENDYCLRATAAGFQLAVADQLHVYHAKSRSYTHRRRRTLSRRGQRALRRKHDESLIDRALDAQRENRPLAAARRRAARAIATIASGAAPAANSAWPITREGHDQLHRVLYLLPVRGGGGGAHSVVQEARGMRDLGTDAQIAVDVKYRPAFRQNYPEIAADDRLFFYYSSTDELTAHAPRFDVVVATVYFSVALVKSIVDVHPHVLPAYYVQDYEPRFFRRFSPRWLRARASYGRVPGMLHFAKTAWVRETVHARHGIRVAAVQPSLDHDVFYPAAPRAAEQRPVRVTAMIRPATVYRGAARTMRVLRRLKAKNQQSIEIEIFGSSDDEIETAGLTRDFPFTNHGVLTRRAVANLLRRGDLFLDLSDYQAFGRTGLEAMASGVAVVLPRDGGAGEYAVDGENALLVDTRSEDACLRAAERLITDQALRQRLRERGIETAARYSIPGAAESIIALFTEHAQRRRSRASNSPRRVHTASSNGHRQPARVQAIVPRSAGGRLAGSTYVRLALPLRHRSVRDRLELGVSPYRRGLVDSAELIVVQRNAIAQLDDAERLADECHASGTPLVYEIDDDLLALPDSHPEAAGYRRQQPAMRRLIERADLVTVPTAELARRLAQLNGQVRVVPNALDDSLWFDGGRSKMADVSAGGPVRILVMGTRTHAGDLAIVAEAARRLRRAFGRQVSFDVIGCIRPGTRADWFRELPVPHAAVEYPAFVRWLRRQNRWQIGLAPLEPSTFNDAKSGLKFFDYSALGLASVASDVSAYRNEVSQLSTGILTGNNTQSWHDTLELLITDAALRCSLASAAQRHVAVHHTLDTQVRRWLAVYGELIPGLSPPTPAAPSPVAGL